MRSANAVITCCSSGENLTSGIWVSAAGCTGCTFARGACSLGSVSVGMEGAALISSVGASSGMAVSAAFSSTAAASAVSLASFSPGSTRLGKSVMAVFLLII